MDKVSNFIQRKSDSLVGVMSRKDDDLFLPVSTKPRARFQVRALLGHCLYRRVVIWTLVVIGLFSITLFNPQITQSRNVLDLVQLGKGEIPVSQASKIDGTDAHLVKQDGKGGEDESPKQADAKPKSKDSGKNKNKGKTGNGKKKNKNGPHWLDYEQ